LDWPADFCDLSIERSCRFNKLTVIAELSAIFFPVTSLEFARQCAGRLLIFSGTNMLTATYSIIALKVEQNRARWTFSSLQQTILNGLRNLRQAGGIDLDALLGRLTQFEQYCHRRKMEVIVIPTLRRFTHEVDALLDEIEALGRASMALLRSLREKLQGALGHGSAMLDDIVASLEQCCAQFHRRLAAEEALVQVAERVIPGEAWFGIAASFLSEDEKTLKHKERLLDEEE
jgi:hypothetical protein